MIQLCPAQSCTATASSRLRKKHNASNVRCKQGLQSFAGCRSLAPLKKVIVQPQNPTQFPEIFQNSSPALSQTGFYLSVLSLSRPTLSFQTQTHKGLLRLHLYPWTRDTSQLLPEHDHVHHLPCKNSLVAYIVFIVS